MCRERSSRQRYGPLRRAQPPGAHRRAPGQRTHPRASRAAGAWPRRGPASRPLIHGRGGRWRCRRPARRTRVRPARSQHRRSRGVPRWRVGPPVHGCDPRRRHVLCNARDRSGKFNMSRLELPDAARQPHGELVVSDGDQHTRAFDARYLRDRVGKLRRTAEGQHREYRRRSAVQHHPVANVLCGEKVPPALLAHVRLRHKLGLPLATVGQPPNAVLSARSTSAPRARSCSSKRT